MTNSCIFVLLVTACSVHAKVISNYSQNEIASSHLDTEIDMISKATYNSRISNDYPKVPGKKALDCADVLQMGYKKSRVYEIWSVSRVTGGKHLYVYCDMTTNGGGWTVIQRRGDFQKPKDYFYRDWRNYKEGFGEIEKDFWLDFQQHLCPSLQETNESANTFNKNYTFSASLMKRETTDCGQESIYALKGNDNIFALTNQKLYSVRFDLKDFQENARYAHYNNFWIDDEDHNYTLHISVYTGDAVDSMQNHNNQPFSTKDQKNNKQVVNNCAEERKGAWWYNGCYEVNLNGLYHKGKYDTIDGISWEERNGKRESLAWTEIKIRPKNFRLSFS